MVKKIANELGELKPENQQKYQENASKIYTAVRRCNFTNRFKIIWKKIKIYSISSSICIFSWRA